MKKEKQIWPEPGKENAPRINKGRKLVVSPAPENSQHTPIPNSASLILTLESSTHLEKSFIYQASIYWVM